MDLRREKSKLVNKRRGSIDLFNNEHELISSNNHNPPPTSTPIRVNNRSEDEESPYFPCSTQEMREDVDVLWDYNSPQSKPKTSVVRKSKKRLNLLQSPKVPFRRHPSNNNEQIKQDFCKLHEELKALRAEMAKPDHEESLVLSPREEEVFKITQDDLLGFDNVIEEHPTFESDFDDPFDDDMDDKLLFFTQQVESEVEKTETGARCKNTYNQNTEPVCGSRNSLSSPHLNKFNFQNGPEKTLNNCDTRPIPINQHFFKTGSISNNTPTAARHENITHQYNSKINVASNSPTVKRNPVKSLQDSEVFNDSFDNVLSQMDEDDFDQLTQVMDIKQYKNDRVDNTDKISRVFPRSQSEDKVQFSSITTTVSSKVEWHRTQSFESYSNTQLTKEKMQEIERKRLEAKAKLEAKKKQDPVISTIPEISDSPLKCSPEEIEKKRLQALAKLEAKRQQDIIEKKKQEALKRREETRKKNASQVKSSLTTRL